MPKVHDFDYDETTRCWNVPTEIKVPEVLIRDLWETARGYCGYWAADLIRKDADRGAAHYVREHEPQEAMDYAFTSATLADAIRRIIEGRVEIGESIRADILTGLVTGDVDADAADCIVQVACFGEIVYG